MFVLIGTYLLALPIAPHGMCSMVLGLDIKQLRTVENKPCKSAPRSRQITMPAPHHSVCYRLDALPATQPTSSKHWRQLCYMLFLFCYMLNALKIIVYFGAVCWATFLWDSTEQFPNVSLFAFIYAFCVCLCFFLLADECYSHSRNVNLGFSGTQKLENALGATLL